MNRNAVQSIKADFSYEHIDGDSHNGSHMIDFSTLHPNHSVWPMPDALAAKAVEGIDKTLRQLGIEGRKMFIVAESREQHLADQAESDEEQQQNSEPKE